MYKLRGVFMEKFYGEVFSRLEKHIKTIENKQGAWMFTLIISGAISLFSFMLWMRISPPNSSKDFLNLSLPLSYFSKTVMSPFSCVLSFWVATSFLKNNMAEKISNSEFLAKASVYTLVTIVLASVFNTRIPSVSVIVNVISGFVYSVVMYDKFKPDFLNKATITAAIVKIVVSAIGFLIGTTLLFFIILN